MSAVDFLGPGNAQVGVLQTYALQYTEIKKTFHQVIQNSILSETSDGCNDDNESNFGGSLLRDRLRSELKKFETSVEEEVQASLTLKEWIEAISSALVFQPLSSFAQGVIPQVKRRQRSARARIFARTSELAGLKEFLDELHDFIDLISPKLASIGSSSPLITSSGCETPKSSPVNLLQSWDSKLEIPGFSGTASENELFLFLWNQFLLPWLSKSFEVDNGDEAYKLVSTISSANVTYLRMLASLVTKKKLENQEEFERGCGRLVETQRALQDLRKLLIEHSVVSVDKALSNIWGHVLHNLETLQEWNSTLTAEEIKQVKQQWVGVSEAVHEMGKVLLTGLSPPDDINDVFSVMHYIQQDFKNVRKQFRDLLNVPQLQLLQVDDPFRNQAPAEQVGQLERVRESKVDLMQVICRFYKEYQKLEDESRRIIEELCFYAETQVNLLPAIGRPGETSLETYLADREEHVAKLNQEVSTMSCIKERHRELKVDWELLQVTVGALLEKEEQDSKSYDQKIEDLIRNRKEFGKKPLFDLLKEIGGLGCISWEMALFSKIGAVVGSAIFVGGVVVAACTWAWSIYSTRKERNEAISKYREYIKECLRKVGTLQSALPLIDNIAQLLAKLIYLSGSILRHLNTVCTWRKFYEAFFAILQPSIVAKWRDTKVMCETYLELTRDQGEGVIREVASEMVDPNRAVPDVALQTTPS